MHSIHFHQITNPLLSFSMVGALNKLPIAVFGMIFFDAVVSTASVSSVLIGMSDFFIACVIQTYSSLVPLSLLAFVAGGLYSYAKSYPQYTLPLYSKVETSAEK